MNPVILRFSVVDRVNLEQYKTASFDDYDVVVTDYVGVDIVCQIGDDNVYLRLMGRNLGLVKIDGASFSEHKETNLVDCLIESLSIDSVIEEYLGHNYPDLQKGLFPYAPPDMW
jgi:hypothetical protein